MTNAEQLERETEEARTNLSHALDELRACMTPRTIIDQLADRVSDGAGAAFARNLKDQAVANPLPIAMMGASLAWMMLGARSGSANGTMRQPVVGARDATGDVTDPVRATIARTGDEMSSAPDQVADVAGSSVERAGETVSRTGQSVRDAAGSAAASARQTADGVRETAGSMVDSVRSRASGSYDTLAESARRTTETLSASTDAARQQTMRAGSSLLEFCREQPLLLTGIGVVVGALMGALLPATEAENRLMGETSDQMKDRAQDLASEQYDQAKKVGERALEAGQNEAAKQMENAEDKPEGGATLDPKSDQASIVPDEAPKSDEERSGQPWNAENSPV